MVLSISKADGMAMGGAEVIPAEKALGNLRPLRRRKPRSPVSLLTGWDFRLLKTPPRSGANTGAVLPRSDMPSAPLPAAAASAPVNASILAAARFWYQRTNIMAVSTRTARPATPPTIPPASTEGGGVPSSLPDDDDPVPFVELEAVAVAGRPVSEA
jgi:hypothetical protein